jgi:hypothetical protein
VNTTQLPDDFKEFLRLVDDHDVRCLHDVRYLIVGGCVVGFHGYPRSTGDMGVWVQTTSENADCECSVCIIAPIRLCRDDPPVVPTSRWRQNVPFGSHLLTAPTPLNLYTDSAQTV